MNRRTFFSRVFGGVAAATLAPFLPKLLVEAAPAVVPTTVPLMFHPEAFAFAMEDIRLEEFRARYIKPAVAALADEIDRKMMSDLGLSIRFVKGFERNHTQDLTRYDVLFGAPARSDFACKVVG